MMSPSLAIRAHLPEQGRVMKSYSFPPGLPVALSRPRTPSTDSAPPTGAVRGSTTALPYPCALRNVFATLAYLEHLRGIAADHLLLVLWRQSAEQLVHMFLRPE